MAKAERVQLQTGASLMYRVVLLKKNTGWNWHREDQVLRQSRDLILNHRSCFFDPNGLNDPDFQLELYERGADKLDMFLGWLSGIQDRFPALKGGVPPSARTGRFRH